MNTASNSKGPNTVIKFSLTKKKNKINNQQPPQRKGTSIITATNELQIQDSQSGLSKLSKGGESILFNNSLLHRNEALVLADAFIRLLEYSAPELSVIREVHISPLVREFVEEYTAFVPFNIDELIQDLYPEPELVKREEIVAPIQIVPENVVRIEERLKRVQEVVENLTDDVSTVKNQTKMLAASLQEKETEIVVKKTSEKIKRGLEEV